MATIEILPDTTALTRATAERIVGAATEAIARSGRFSIALSGGGTPRPVYELLATPPFATQVDWERVHLFWGDERCVPPIHKDSNYRMVREALIDHVPIPSANLHRMRGEDDPATAAAAYEAVLRHVLGSDGLDMALQGMGDDGHTASLFPGQQAVHETERLVVAEYIAAVGMWRITLTPPALNAAQQVVFLVAGGGKATRLKEVIEGPRDISRLPSQVVQPSSGNLIWLLDTPAAAQLR